MAVVTTIAVAEDAIKATTIMTATHSSHRPHMTKAKRKARLTLQELLTHMPPMVVTSSIWPCGTKPTGSNSNKLVDRLLELRSKISTDYLDRRRSALVLLAMLHVHISILLN